MFKSTRKFRLIAIGSQEPIVTNLFVTDREKKLCKKLFERSGIERPTPWANSYDMTLYVFCGVFVYWYKINYIVPIK